MNFSGHGLMDLSAYDAYLSGRLEDAVPGDDEIGRLTENLKKLA